MTRRTLLVIDDQRSVCVSLAYFLELANYRVLKAESGEAGLALAEHEAVDGALIDVHMPVMNGFDTCLRLQSQAQVHGRALRVWFMTGAFSSDFERRSADLGALGVIPKPFDHPAFLARLEEGFSSPAPSVPSAAASANDQMVMRPT